MNTHLRQFYLPLLLASLLASESLTVGFCECLGEFVFSSDECYSKTEVEGSCCCPEKEQVPVPCKEDCTTEILLELEDFVFPETGRYFGPNEEVLAAQSFTYSDFSARDQNLRTSTSWNPPSGAPPPVGPTLEKLCLLQV